MTMPVMMPSIIAALGRRVRTVAARNLDSGDDDHRQTPRTNLIREWRSTVVTTQHTDSELRARIEENFARQGLMSTLGARLGQIAPGNSLADARPGDLATWLLPWWRDQHYHRTCNALTCSPPMQLPWHEPATSG